MKRWMYTLIPLLILGSLIGWRLNEKRVDNAAQVGQRAARMKSPPLVSIALAQVRDVAQVFEATGSVEAPLNVKISPKVTGRIEFLNLREGDRVRKGQVLVRIDPSQVEAQVLQQQAGLAEAEFRLAQAQLNLNPTSVSVNTQIRQQAAGVSSSKADYNQVHQNYAEQLAAAAASVTDAQAKVENASAAIASSKANLDNARIKLNRILDLYKLGYIAAQDVDDAKATVAVQEAGFRAATAARDSALAQKKAIENQANIVKTKGKADIEASAAKLEQSRASLDYAKANSVQTSVYKQSLSALRATVAAARAGLRAAEAQRADTVLRSPLDGFVTGRQMDPGAMATPAQPILTVQFMKQVWVTISVPEEISLKLHIGQPAKVAFDSIPGRAFQGSIIQINPAADPQSRLFTARVIMSNKDNQFRPGMFGRVFIETDRVKDTVAVPREAIQTDDTGAAVMVVDQAGKVRKQIVATGVSDTDYVAISQGLKAGDKVVTMSAFPVRDGQMVRLGGGKRKRGPQ